MIASIHSRFNTGAVIAVNSTRSSLIKTGKANPLSIAIIGGIAGAAGALILILIVCLCRYRTRDSVYLVNGNEKIHEATVNASKHVVVKKNLVVSSKPKNGNVVNSTVHSSSRTQGKKPITQSDSRNHVPPTANGTASVVDGAKEVFV